MAWSAKNILSSETVSEFASHLLEPQCALSTGFPSWDEACEPTGGRGVADWWYVLIGGASNSGKTQLMRWLAKRALSGSGPMPSVGIVTMEVPRSGLQRQFYADMTSLGYYDLLHDRWVQGDPDQKHQHLKREVKEYLETTARSGRLFVAEFEGRPTLSEVEDMVAQLAEAGCSTVFLDHAQLVKPDHRGMSVAEAAEELSERLRVFAHRTRTRTFVLSQLNRSASRERDRRPTMHDLWGGTSMESNANQVVLLDHSRTAKATEDQSILRTHLLLDKNREGPARISIPVEVDFRRGEWRQALPDELHLWPGERR